MSTEFSSSREHQPARRAFFREIRASVSKGAVIVRDVTGYLLHKALVSRDIESIIHSGRLQMMQAHFLSTFANSPHRSEFDFEGFIQGHYPDVANKLSYDQLGSLCNTLKQAAVMKNAETTQMAPATNVSLPIRKIIKTGLATLKNLLPPSISSSEYLSACSDWHEVLRERQKNYPNETRYGEEWRNMQYYLFYEMLNKYHSHLTDPERRYLAEKIIQGGQKTG